MNKQAIRTHFTDSEKLYCGTRQPNYAPSVVAHDWRQVTCKMCLLLKLKRGRFKTKVV